ncbi:MAG: hypothetical protein KDA57_21380 [Planctomycetales bacterium]|nr:hypothetical protein [Planctomycetales bacterium]
MSPEMYAELESKAIEMEFTGVLPRIASTLAWLDDAQAIWGVSLEQSVTAPEQGRLQIRHLQCTYDGSWQCSEWLRQYIEHRGRRVEIAADISTTDARDALDMMEDSLSQPGHQSKDKSPLKSSDLDHIKSLEWKADDVWAWLEVDSGCGVGLHFQRVCTDDTCRLIYLGYYYAV